MGEQERSLEGTFCIWGYQTCRTTNSFLLDFLESIGKSPQNQYIRIEENVWYLEDTAEKANHVVVHIDEDQKEFFLDLLNGYYFDKNMNYIDVDSTVLINEERYSLYIAKIRKIISKYKGYENVGVQRVYSLRSHP